MSKEELKELIGNLYIDYNMKDLAIDVDRSDKTLKDYIENILNTAGIDIYIVKIDLNNPECDIDNIRIITKLPCNTENISCKFGYGYYPLLVLVLKLYEIDPFINEPATEDEFIIKYQSYIEKVHDYVEMLPRHLQDEIKCNDIYINSFIDNLNINYEKQVKSFSIKGLRDGKRNSYIKTPLMLPIEVENSKNLHQFLIDKLIDNIVNEFNYRAGFRQVLSNVIKFDKAEDILKDINDIKSFYELYIWNKKMRSMLEEEFSDINELKFYINKTKDLQNQKHQL